MRDIVIISTPYIAPSAPATDYFITKRKFYYKEKVDSMKDVLFKITKLFDNFVKSTGEL